MLSAGFQFARHDRMPANVRPDTGNELCRGHGLDDDVIGAMVESREPLRLDHGACRNHDREGSKCGITPYGVQSLDPAHPRHVQIQEQHLDRVVLDELESAAAVCRCEDNETGPLKGRSEE